MEDSLKKYLTFKNIIFTIVAILFLIFLNNIKEIVIMFFASFVIACSLEPLIKLFEKKFSRKISSSIVMVLLLSVICIFFIPLIFIAGNEIKNIIASFPQYLVSIKNLLASVPFVNKAVLQQLDAGDMISSASGVTSQVFAETLNVGKNIGSAFIYFVASLIIIYYLMFDKQNIKNTLLRLFPKQFREHTSEIYDNISEKIGGYIIAQIITMASVGIIMTIGLVILKVDYAFLLGLLTAVLDIIPVIGPACALAICLIIAYKSGTFVLFMIIVIFALAQLAENNFVRPYIFGKFLDLHPLIIYLFLFLTAKYFGVIGVVFAPALAATAVVLLEEVYMKNIE